MFKLEEVLLPCSLQTPMPVLAHAIEKCEAYRFLLIFVTTHGQMAGE